VLQRLVLTGKSSIVTSSSVLPGVTACWIP